MEFKDYQATKVAEAAKAFALDYLSDNDSDVAERVTWCDMLRELELFMGKCVFELADEERLKKAARKAAEEL